MGFEQVICFESSRDPVDGRLTDMMQDRGCRRRVRRLIADSKTLRMISSRIADLTRNLSSQISVCYVWKVSWLYWRKCLEFQVG